MAFIMSINTMINITFKLNKEAIGVMHIGIKGITLNKIIKKRETLAKSKNVVPEEVYIVILGSVENINEGKFMNDFNLTVGQKFIPERYL